MVLKDLEEKSIFILRELYSRFKNPAVLWSMGKDSTVMLELCRKSFFGKIPFPVIHIDTGRKFKEMYEFRNKISKEWNLNLIIAKNEKKEISPETVGHYQCCNILKTETLKQTVQKYKFDALILAIRRDEHAMRNIERYFSPRDKEFNWSIVEPKKPGEKGDAPFNSLQPASDIWNLYQTDFGEDCSHVRVHPILHWNELNVWEYIKKENIPVNPLYFADYVEKNYNYGHNYRFRSLGCESCTKPVKSNAKTIDEIIEELKTTKEEERSGRCQDKEDIMRKLRALGYM